MEGFIVTKGTKAKTYIGYRCATDDMEVNEGEQFIESLEDWSQEVLELPKSPQDKLRELTALISTLDNETQADFLSASAGIATALNAGQVGVAIVVVNRIDTQGDAQLDALKQTVLAILEA
jgi:glutamate mutase epsilon subunit